MKLRQLFGLILFICCSKQLKSQIDTRGTDFWLTFSAMAPVDVYQIRILTDDSVANGFIYFTKINDSVAFQVFKGEVFVYDLNYTQKNAVQNYQAWQVMQQSAHITSDNQISVFAAKQHPYSSDAAIIFPTTSLDTSYRVITYGTNGWDSDNMAIIATEDSTNIFYNGQFWATLQKGDVFYVYVGGNFTFQPYMGGLLKSNKPIAVFSFNWTTIISDSSAFDMLFNQMMPISTFGKEYFIPVNKHTGAGRVRITPTENGTDVVVHGGILKDFSRFGGTNRLSNLYVGQWIELDILSDSNGCFISSNKPIGVCNFVTYGHGVGDPGHAWMPPIYQRIKKASITPFMFDTSLSAIRDHYALVVTPTKTKDSTTMTIGNGISLPMDNTLCKDHPSGYSYYEIPLLQDTFYSFENNVAGVMVFCSGLGYKESYHYLGASTTYKKGTLNLIINEIPYKKLNTEYFCDGNTHFQANVTGLLSSSPGHIKWYINGNEEISARDSLSWSKKLFNGIHYIKLEAIYEHGFLIDTLIIETNVSIATLEVETSSTPEFCNKENGSILFQPTSLLPNTIEYIANGISTKSNVLSGLASDMYFLTIKDTFCTIYDSIFVDFVDGPTAEFEATPQIICVNDEISFFDQSTTTGKIVQWQWDFGDNNYSTSQHPKHVYNTENEYFVYLKITDDNQCEDTISHKVVVLESLDFPNIYTPKGSDNVQYFFRPLKIVGHFKSFEMTIFNRWGNIIWQQTCKEPNCPNYTDDSFWWNGTNKNSNQVSEGVYYWIITAEYHSPNTKPLKKSGSVTVLKD